MKFHENMTLSKIVSSMFLRCFSMLSCKDGLRPYGGLSPTIRRSCGTPETVSLHESMLKHLRNILTCPPYPTSTACQTLKKLFFDPYLLALWLAFLFIYEVHYESLQYTMILISSSEDGKRGRF